MAIQAGFRSYVRVDYLAADATANAVKELDYHGSIVMVEVTATAACNFFPNVQDPADQTIMAGRPAGKGIPIAAGATRAIPMNVLNFRADGAVTVVGYGL